MQRLAAIVLLVPLGCRDDAAAPPASTAETTSPTTSTASSESTAMAGTTSSAEVTTQGEGSDDAPKLDLGTVPDAGVDQLPGCDRLAELGPSSLGCEFWATDLLGVYPDLGLGIGIGNPGDEPVHAVIEDLRGPGGTVREVGAFTIGPTQSEVIAVNGFGGLVPGEDVPVHEGLVPRSAFRVTSDRPITVMQINPLSGAPSVIPEASLLLPTTSLGSSYRALGFDGGIEGDFVLVVAVEDDTRITSVEGDVELDAFDGWYWKMWTPDDAMGFFVGADKPIAMFSGNHCTYVGGVTACDHLEEQVAPLAAWGTHYVAAMHPARVARGEPHEPVVWRVLAAVDDTTVTLSPPVADSPIHLAAAGDYVELTTDRHFVASSDDEHPFMLVQYMVGASQVVDGCDQGTAAGDPWMVQMVPTAQWLPSVPFSTDTSYVRDFVFIVRSTGTSVSLDCFGAIPDARFEPVGDSGYEVGWIDLDRDGTGGEGECVDGQQFVSADAPIGVYVGGVDCYASYGYPGGLSLNALWDPPTTPEG